MVHYKVLDKCCRHIMITLKLSFNWAFLSCVRLQWNAAWWHGCPQIRRCMCQKMGKRVGTLGSHWHSLQMWFYITIHPTLPYTHLIHCINSTASIKHHKGMHMLLSRHSPFVTQYKQPRNCTCDRHTISHQPVNCYWQLLLDLFYNKHLFM